MTLDEIMQAFASSEKTPETALRQAVLQASDLAPRIIELLREVDRGNYLLPGPQQQLFYGLYALAAAKHSGACEAFVDVLHCSEYDLEAFLGDAITEQLASLIVGLYDGNADALYDVIDDDGASAFIKWGVFQALAYLVWQDRIPRAGVIEILERVAANPSAPHISDPVWAGWRDAIHLLGATELKQQAIDAWDLDECPDDHERDKQHWIDEFTPEMSERKFSAAKLEPIVDPVEALDWGQQWDSQQLDPEAGSLDPARASRLTPQELHWLSGLFASSQAPQTAMSFEAVDGFLSALAVGPEHAPPSFWMPRIWDIDCTNSIAYVSEEQMLYTTELLLRHWNTITTRLEHGFEHSIYVDRVSRFVGTQWALGFSLAIAEYKKDWQKLTRDEAAAESLSCIMQLIAHEFDDDYDPEVDSLRYDERLEIVTGQIPLALETLYARRNVRQPIVRTAKTGRNDPCPCGSGRKFKACCIDTQTASAN